MLVFKNATNLCLIGRDVLATHPDTKQHVEALMGSEKTTTSPASKKINNESKIAQKLNDCKNRNCDLSSNDDYDEMDDAFNENSATKGCWATIKTKIDDSIENKVPINIDRNVCKTKVNNSIEKKSVNNRECL